MHIHRVRTFAAVVTACAGLSACGAEGGSAPQAGPAARIDVVASPPTPAAAGGTAGAFTVKVADAANIPVAGVTVTFGTTGAVTVTPTAALTNAEGLATTQVTVGSVAGTATLRASTTGVAATATTSLAIVAGPATKIVVSPKTMRFLSVGDTARIVASAQDQFGNVAGASAIAYSVGDPTLVSVDQAGLVRVLRQPGNTLVISTSNGRADTTAVTVLALGATNCTGVVNPTTMALGDVQTFSGTQYACVTGATAGAEFTVVAFNSSSDATTPLSVSVTANGVASVPTLFTAPTGGALALRSAVGGTSSPLPKADDQFHLRLLEQARALPKGIISRTRALRRMSASRSITPSALGQGASRSVISSNAKVGDLVTMNVSGNVCTNPINHAMRVTAIGAKSIILADTLNPAGGFVDADYARIAANFDTLIYPVDVAAFGAPSDYDKNEKVAILFTRAVNELVTSNSGYFVGGFFNPRDLFPKVGSIPADNCAGSNEGEMFYMLVPAPGTGINGVTHTVGFVDSLATGIIAHEFQHLINASRRMYVNTSAEDFEEIWLNEGLSHIAEELLYYHESGFAPRQNLTDAIIRDPGRVKYGFWKSDAASNFTRFLSYLQSPGGNSPVAQDDELATRGATWSFLRYLADRLRTTDGDLWQRFTNSTVTGIATLTSAIGEPPSTYFRDWAIANYMDDFGGNTEARFQHKSWNFRDIYTTTFLNLPTYPLRVTGLTDNVKTDFAVRGQSASYARFAVSAGREALLTFSSGGGLPSSPLQFVVIRTK